MYKVVRRIILRQTNHIRHELSLFRFLCEVSASMVFSDKDKAIIENVLLKRTGQRTKYGKNGSKGWVLSSVKRLVKKFKEAGTMERKGGSGRPVTATAIENQMEVDELICSEEEPGSHTHPGYCRPVVNGRGLKMNALRYRDHFKKEFFSAIKKFTK